MLQRHRDKVIAGAVIAAIVQAPALWRVGTRAVRAVQDYFFQYTPTEGDLYMDPLDLLGLPVEASNILKEERGTATFFREFTSSGPWNIDPGKGLCKRDTGGLENSQARLELWEDLVIRDDEEADDDEGDTGEVHSSRGSQACPIVVAKSSSTRGLYRPT
eukprot:GGOE01053849.1.p1 GENE.GGOE01053849.1~~GGOE01053849.1.p1  ORF type:complete len:160 (+),score=31.95 GGOE01053849.1:59-538(+)